MKLAFVFPGQGSQSVGMLDSFAENETVQNVLARANAALGEDLAGMIQAGPAEVLNLTVNTQPAMLTASVAMYEAWCAMGGKKPEIMAGHSLGEYSALTAAGVFSLEEAVKLVKFRASAMQEAVPVGVGAMAAVLGFMITGAKMSAKVSGTATDSIKEQTAVEFINRRIWEANATVKDDDKIWNSEHPYYESYTHLWLGEKICITTENPDEDNAVVVYRFGDNKQIELCPGKIYFETIDNGTVIYYLNGEKHVVHLRVAEQP